MMMMTMIMTSNYNVKIVILTMLMSRDSGTLAELEVARSDPEMISGRSGWLNNPHPHFHSDGDHDEVCGDDDGNEDRNDD